MFGLASFVKEQARKLEEARRQDLIRTTRAFKVAERVQQILDRDGDKTWTTGDGTRVLVREMGDSHLFYALAKARRGEYPDSYSRQTGIHALEGEALRRLATVY